MARTASTSATETPSAPAAGVTPMMAQYFENKAQAGDALLFYRMGDFYELFFDDAIAAAEALDIALTKRGKHGGDDIPMCGVPAATAETYLSRLISKGFRVAVCEQTEDPKEAKKRGAKSVVRREIVRVVTPGTITEDGLLDARAAAWMCAIAPAGRGRQLGLAWADITTGAFYVGDATAQTLGERLAALAPREVLAPDIALESLFDEPAKAALDRAQSALTPVPKAKFNAASARQRLQGLFGVNTLDGFGDFAEAEIAAAGALVDYVELTQAGARAQLSPPVKGGAHAALAIDPATRASLEVERTLSGARQGSLLHAIDRTVTAPGARLLAQRLALPLTTPAAIHARHDAVAVFMEAAPLRDDVRAQLKTAGDPARALSRLLLTRGGPRDLRALSAALKAGSAAAALFQSLDAPWPPEIAQACEALDLNRQDALHALADTIEATISEETPLLARDGGFVRPGADAALDEACALRDNSKRVIAGLEGRYREETGLAALKIKHNNVLGYFVEVTARHGDRLLNPPHNAQFIHRQTMANAVRFTTTELADLEQRMREAGAEALARELAIFEALSAEVAAAEAALRGAAQALAVLDVAAANAAWAVEANAVRPTIDDGLSFEIERGRHPVVEAALTAQGEAFAPNHCRLDGAGPDSLTGAPRLAFVTGPNMAGKSTYLRQNALMIILAQAGCYVPAARARIGVADRVFSRVGAADDLARGRSTFMAEMVETAAILNQAGPRAFVILDEIGRGTATYDGLAIAWAVAEHLHDVNQSRAMFATHYHELTRLAETLGGAANLHLRAKAWDGGLVFLHEVASGAADRSYGVEVARRAGLPKAATARAQDILERLEGRAGGGALSALGGVADALDDLPLFQAAPAPTPSQTGAPDDTGYDGAGGLNYPEGVEENTAALEQARTVLDALGDIDPDSLTPREALEALYALQDLAKTAL